MANDLSKVIALADLGEAILATVKESGLMRKRRRAGSSNGRRAKRQATERTVTRPAPKAEGKASKKSVARKPLMDQIPDE